MSYDRELAFNLRIRGLSEEQVSETLDEVRAHESATGSAAEDEFGPAKEYATQFPKGKQRSRGAMIATVGAALAVAYVAVGLVILPFMGVDIRDFVGPLELLPALVLGLGGVLAGFLPTTFGRFHAHTGDAGPAASPAAVSALFGNDQFPGTCSGRAHGFDHGPGPQPRGRIGFRPGARPLRRVGRHRTPAVRIADDH